jgi:hypothetical protein
MPLFVKGDGTVEEDEKYVHVMLSTFGFTGSTVFITVTLPGILYSWCAWQLRGRRSAVSSQPRPPHGPAPGTPRPTQRDELTATLPSRQRPRNGCVPVTVASPARHPALPRVRDKRALRPRPSPCPGIPPSTPSLTALGVLFRAC